MDTILLCLISWLLAGAAIFLHVCWLIRPRIVVADLLVAIPASIFGPFAVLFYIQVLDGTRWTSRVIYERKHRSAGDEERQ